MPNTLTPTPLVQKGPVSIGAPSVTVQQQLGAAQPTTTPSTPLEVTKFQFRKLFTFNERLAVDNIQYNTALSGSVKAAVSTMQKDVEVSAVVNLHMPDVIAGINFLTSIGILSPQRAIRIKSNLPPL